MYSSPIAIWLRSLSRSLGLNKVFAPLVSGGSRIVGIRRESNFEEAFCASLRCGDRVWDVGANIGEFTDAFLKIVAPQGRVIAIEPSMACFAELQKRFRDVPRVTLINIALGDRDGIARMMVNSDPRYGTHRIVNEPLPEQRGAEVAIRTADSIIGEDPLNFPNAIKIDVEGHEGAVIDGLRRTLEDRRLRSIGIEVHFQQLAERGEPRRPAQIERSLVDAGFKVRWTDPSHVLATRPSSA